MRDAPIPKKNISSLIRGIRFVRKMKCVQSKLSKVIQDLCGGLGKEVGQSASRLFSATILEDGTEYVGARVYVSVARHWRILSSIHMY